MSIASLNINGFGALIDEVTLLIQNLGTIFLPCVNYAWSIFPKELTAINGYQQKRLERTCHGGGVSIYVQNSINYKKRTDLSMGDLELIHVEILPPRNKPFLLFSLVQTFQ